MRCLVTDVEALGTLSLLPVWEECGTNADLPSNMVLVGSVVQDDGTRVMYVLGQHVLDIMRESLTADLDAYDIAQCWALQHEITRIAVSAEACAYARELSAQRVATAQFRAADWAHIFGAQHG